MNVAHYGHGYDGSNDMARHGYAFTGPEITEIGHGCVEVITREVESYFGIDDRRTLVRMPNPAPTAIECGHIPVTSSETRTSRRGTQRRPSPTRSASSPGLPSQKPGPFLLPVC